jgi:proline iminopeptidase
MQKISVKGQVYSDIIYLEAENVSIYYEYFFTDATLPTMVVLAGGPGFGLDLYKPQVEAFQSQANILLFDPFGCGQSSRAENIEDYTINKTMDVAAALIKKLGELHYFKKAIIHGTSYGGIAALGFAIKYPELTAGLIIVSGTTSYHFLELAKAKIKVIGNEAQVALCENYLWPGRFDENSAEAFFQHMTPIYAKSVTEVTENPYASSCAISVTNQAFKNEYDHFDWTPDLHKITCPVLILAGRYDWITPPELVEIIPEKIKHAMLTIFEEAGHALFKDAPGQYKKEITGFLNKFAVCF